MYVCALLTIMCILRFLHASAHQNLLIIDMANVDSKILEKVTSVLHICRLNKDKFPIYFNVFYHNQSGVAVRWLGPVMGSNLELSVQKIYNSVQIAQARVAPKLGCNKPFDPRESM